MPRRGPEAGIHRREDNFHGPEVTPIGSCAFIQKRIPNRDDNFPAP
jgi:hypothetical protein